MGMRNIHVSQKVIIFLKNLSFVMKILSKPHVTVRMVVVVDRHLTDRYFSYPIFLFTISLYKCFLVTKSRTEKTLPIFTRLSHYNNPYGQVFPPQSIRICLDHFCYDFIFLRRFSSVEKIVYISLNNHIICIILYNLQNYFLH